MRSGGGELVGRDVELGRLAGLVHSVLSGDPGPAGAVVSGEPGIGRTALLAGVASRAATAGVRVLALRGTAAEHGIERAALADLLLPLRGFVSGLAPVQRSMLLGCLALRPPLRPGPADELVVCTAARAVLAAAGRHTPLLVVVDDVQWVDDPSRRVLLYVARRLAGERVAVLLAHRDGRAGAGPPTDLDGLPVLRLGGLDEDACRELVCRAGGTVPDGLALAAVTGGNPQALRDGLAGGRWQPLDLGPGLRRAWSAALRGLPAPTRTALAALTAAPSADAAELAPVLAALRLTDADLEPARRAGLLRPGPAADVPHPLLGAAVRAAVPAAVRGRVLRALSRYADGDLLAGPAAGGGPRATAVWVAERVLAGGEPAARAALAACLALPGVVPTMPADPWELRAGALLAQDLLWLEDVDAARRMLDPVLDRARAAGAGLVLAHALVVRAELDWRRGAWAASYAAATDALRRARRDGAAAGPALVALARVDAVRGDAGPCRDRLALAVRVARPARLLPLRVPAVHGLAALGDGDVDTAVAHLEQAWEHAVRHGVHGADAVAVAADLAEAWVRAGHPERAAPLAAWLVARAEGSGLLGPAAAAACCRGMLAGDPDAAAAGFAAAHQALARADLPFEQARTLLLEGETLRRLRRPSAARSPLRAAAARFTALGARPWTVRAERELGATGARTGDPASRDPALDPDVTRLSPQELRIARTVADGMNNKEAAAALYLSRKTVEAHLTRVYRKLGVRSRTDLVRRLGTGAAGF